MSIVDVPCASPPIVISGTVVRWIPDGKYYRAYYGTDIPAGAWHSGGWGPLSWKHGVDLDLGGSKSCCRPGERTACGPFGRDD